jgi:excisionase family DNA binding protein
MPRQPALNGAATRPALASFPPILSAEEFADYLQVDPDTVRKRIADGSLPGQKIGKAYRTPRASVEAWERRLGEVVAERAGEVR